MERVGRKKRPQLIALSITCRMKKPPNQRWSLKRTHSKIWTVRCLCWLALR